MAGLVTGFRGSLRSHLNRRWGAFVGRGVRSVSDEPRDPAGGWSGHRVSRLAALAPQPAVGGALVGRGVRSVSDEPRDPAGGWSGHRGFEARCARTSTGGGGALVGRGVRSVSDEPRDPAGGWSGHRVSRLAALAPQPAVGGVGWSRCEERERRASRPGGWLVWSPGFEARCARTSTGGGGRVGWSRCEERQRRASRPKGASSVVGYVGSRRLPGWSGRASRRTSAHTPLHMLIRLGV